MREARRRRLAAAVVAAGLIATAAGCAIPGLSGSDPTTADPSPSPTATMPTEIPSWLLECGADSGKDGDEEDEDSLQLADLDLTTATWSTPPGFEVVTNYVEDNPVETVYSTWYAEPTDPPMATLNVANVVIYTGLDWDDLADGCGRVPLDAIEDQLAAYREQIGARPLSDAVRTEVAGRPALQQDIGLASYSYTGYWLFSRTQLLHIYCQWTTDANRPTLQRGCQDIIASVQIAG